MRDPVESRGSLRLECQGIQEEKEEQEKERVEHGNPGDIDSRVPRKGQGARECQKSIRESGEMIESPTDCSFPLSGLRNP